MCNIAGYVGKKEAMPILIEMMRREEGWDAGFFTGYATISDGKMHTEKVIGSLDVLLQKTDASSAPGNIGFIHSRTPGKKTDTEGYAHPFVTKGERHAFIANGFFGIFSEYHKGEKRERIYQDLKESGVVFRSALQENTPQSFADGVRIHETELLSQYCASKIREGADPVSALEETICTLPEEVVFLMLSLDAPDRIFWSKTSYPMFVGIAPHGTYLATTPQAIPEDAERILYLDHMAGGEVFSDHFTTRPYQEPPARIAAITPSIWARAYQTCEEMVKADKRRYPELEKAVRSLFPEGTLSAEAPVVYSILNEWERNGMIRVERGFVPGQREGLQAPKFYAEWNE